jgi:hypothetical protein
MRVGRFRAVPFPQELHAISIGEAEIQNERVV